MNEGLDEIMQLEVGALTRLSSDIVQLTLLDRHQPKLPPFEPGAHIDIHFVDGTVRQYSLCGDPAERRSYTIAVLRTIDGSCSHRIHDQFHVGTPLKVGLPRNNFRIESSPRYLFIAGGIGITPLLPMITACARRGAPWQLHYCIRDRDDAAFIETLRELGSEQVELHPGRQGKRLSVSELFETLTFPAQTLIYCCGPKRLMDAVNRAAIAEWAGRVRFESFTPATDAVTSTDESIDVYCARSDKTLKVPSNMSILNVFDENRVRVRRSCRQGMCRTCEVKVLEGIPDHRDSVLSQEERAANQSMMVCVSRAKTPRLVLDV